MEGRNLGRWEVGCGFTGRIGVDLRVKLSATSSMGWQDTVVMGHKVLEFSVY